ncbi:MAG: thiosulfate oxidation carrier complex protein SoxZ [Halothiobacillaceae bacterium]|jgi:sulfur-oxidizing protein SoxZ|nr:thiosulfate oxidation carrier complex protein SoxZ [Halothiobacillaceae bacterium]
MATDTIKIRASVAGDVAEVKCLIKHDMETGQRVDKATGNKVPAKFINEISASVNGKEVLTGHMSVAVSKNPYLAFKVPAKSGDAVKVTWKDNTGDTDSAEEKIG